MDKFQVTMFEAGNGDSFLIKCTGKNTTNILVDFGYSYTYKKHTEKYLKSMAANNEKIDLAIITHIDQDHISGGIRFFEDNEFADATKVISVGEVWHNSYKHLDMIETDKPLTERERKHIVRHSLVVEQNHEGSATDTSGKQGSRLAANLNHYGYNWNGSFNGHAISYNPEPIILNNEVKITVLSPTNKELEDLKKTWQNELKSKFPTIALNNDAIFDDAIECISLMRRPSNRSNSLKDTSTTTNLENLAKTVFQEDDDEINASSITCIIEFKNKKILMLGDSVPSIVEAQLKKIYNKSDFPLNFDAIKVSHHGSAKNTNNELLNIIDSEHYFVSTNGNNYGHPDIEMIAKIIVRNNREKLRNIYFTNKLTKLDIFQNEEWQQKYQYRTHYRSTTKDNLQIDL
ncbi:ComEC/Rec2 family competence protein [Bacillus cereus]|uniref:ComEC/Rec2 family competence protein n=1 Tax=Bacillus cereus TaxID=1396 RepID=UPI000BF5E4BD|nr:MBL fold metallo-hydrolase [Bacillus cereus]PEY62888.1 MBL fold metallo-hydrolase [Bacillus cereus]PFT27794.1 MBL fold metallo-hydrolase [Bacillus cereus]PFW02683.1 MBL fold metallo-hydrolase [Bacillus cereus]